MDFGLAKRDAGEVTVTVEGKLLGTPAYMSPEQARGTAHDADERSDIYSLGVVLFELLTGERPFRGGTRMMLHQILMEDAPPPRRFNRRVPKDLETICLKCLEKSPDRRYQEARVLADELRRVMAGKPIHARRISLATRAWRWTKRNPWPAIACCLLLFLAIAGPTIAVQQMNQANIYRWQSYVSDMQSTRQHWESARVGQALAILDRYKQEDFRDFEWHYLARLCRPVYPTTSIPYEAPGHVAFLSDGETLAVTGRRALMLWDTRRNEQIVKHRPHNNLVKGLAVSPDGQTLATGDWDGVLKLWRVAKDHDRWQLSELTTLDVEKTITYHDLSFSPDGRFLATNGGNDVPVWDVERRIAFKLEGHMDSVMCVAFSKQGVLASAGRDRSIKLWNVNSETRIRELGAESDQHTGTVFSVAFSPDGKLLASGSGDDTIRIWDVESGTLQAILEGHANEITYVSFSPNGQSLASASWDGVICLWTVNHWDDEPMKLVGHAGLVLHLAYSPDGTKLASNGYPHVLLWDLTAPLEQDTFVGCRISYFGRGQALTSWASDGLPELCDPEMPKQIEVSPHSYTACSPNRKVIVIGNEDGTIELQRVGSGETELLPDRHNGRVWNVLFSPNGRFMVSVGGPRYAQVLKVWDVGDGRRLASVDVSWCAYPVFSPSSNTLAVVMEDRIRNLHAIKLFRLSDTFEELPTITNEQELPYFSLAFSHRGDLLAAGNVSGEVAVWEVKTGTLRIDPFAAHGSNVYGLAFSPHDTRLASCSADRTVKLWNVSTGDAMLTLRGHHGAVQSVSFSPDGETLASASADGVVRVWRTLQD